MVLSDSCFCNQAGDVSNEEFELLKLKIHQLKEAEKVEKKLPFGCLVMFFITDKIPSQRKTNLHQFLCGLRF